MTTYTHYYAFSAKGIQDFILQGNQLKLMIGGSELIEQLPNAFFNQLLSELNLSQNTDYQILTTNAGGARILFANVEGAKNLIKLFPLAISLYAPGLDFVQVLLPLGDNLARTMSDAEKILQERRNLIFPHLPVAGPLVLRSPRSGLPALKSLNFPGESSEPLDASSFVRRQKAEPASSSLLQKIFPHETRTMAILAEDIGDEHDYIALFHADGNGLGKIVTTLLADLEKTRSLEDSAEQYQKFSTSIEKATTSALRQALAPLLGKEFKQLPFRILICAGDDVTVLLNAKDAIGVVQRFLKAFEIESEKELKLTGIPSLQQNVLTAGVGLVFIHQKYPFAQAYELCESLCKYAKDKTQRKFSAVAFHRVTTSATEDFSTVLKNEMTTHERVELTQMPYTVGKQAPENFSTLESLLELKTAMDAMPRGSLRGLIDEIWGSCGRAEQALMRIETVCTDKGLFRKFEDALRAITKAPQGKSALWNDETKAGFQIRTPIYDALELSAVTGKNLTEFKK